MKKMSSSLVAEIDALIAKVKACPIKAEAVPPAQTSQSAPAPAKQEEEKEQAAPAAAPAATGPRLTEDTTKEGMRAKVVSDVKELRKLWDEAELGNAEDETLESYIGFVGKVLEVEEDDETIQLEWENLDTVWVPWGACIATKEALSSPAPISHLPPGFEKQLDKEMKLRPQPGLVQVEGDYLDIDSVSTGQNVQVTEDIKRFRKEWEEAELGNVEDKTLALYLLQTGKITEIEEDDESIQIRWENYDTAWVPANCVRDAKGGALTSPPAVSCLNPGEVEEEEEEFVFFRRDYAMSGELYLTKDDGQANSIKKGHFQISCDKGYLEQCCQDAGIELPCEAIAGYGGNVTAWKKKLATFKFNNKKTLDVPINGLHKANKKTKKKGSPDLPSDI